MNLQKELDKMLKGVTSSPSKKNVIKSRIEALIAKLKKVWYSKLLEKLLKIKHGEVSLEDYISEVEAKITNN